MTFRSPLQAINDITDDQELLAACQQAGNQGDLASIMDGVRKAQERLDIHLKNLAAEVASIEGETMAGAVGIEPTTLGFGDQCSTN